MERNQEIKISELKANALNLLKGNWGTSVLLNILVGIIQIIPSLINSFFSIYNLLISSILTIFFYFLFFFLSFWRSNCFFELNRENPKLKIKNIFHYFKDKFLISVKYIFFIFLFYYLWLLLIALVLITSGLILFPLLNFIKVQFISLLAFIIILVFIYSIYIRYSMVPYILFENPEMPVLQAFKKGKELIKGYKIKYALMYLSFIGWFILIPITLGIAGLWVCSYFSVTNCEFYRKLKEIKNQDENGENDFLSSEKEKEFKKEIINEYENKKEENLSNDVYIYEEDK